MYKVDAVICRLKEDDVRKAIVEYVNKKYDTNFNVEDVKFCPSNEIYPVEVSKYK